MRLIKGSLAGMVLAGMLALMPAAAFAHGDYYDYPGYAYYGYYPSYYGYGWGGYYRPWGHSYYGGWRGHGWDGASFAKARAPRGRCLFTLAPFKERRMRA
jgi:hypothetical protein